MLEHKVLYTSDVHGNTKQLKALVDYALKVKPDAVIIAGELTPKDEKLGTPQYVASQREFLQNDFPIIVRLLRTQLPETPVFVTLGNDDCAVNTDLLDAQSDLFCYVHGRRVELADGYDVVGYSFVPITPFGLKDFEKHDLGRVSAEVRDEYARLLNNAVHEGVKSTQQGWVGHTFSPTDALRDSIQRDLEDSLFVDNAGQTVYVFHTPPHGTVLDVIQNPRGERTHIGSFAVRDFIQQHQPLVTLHGHIHETVDLSGGQFMERTGSSVSMSAGNDNYASKLSVLVFDLYHPETAQRVQLPCTSFGKLAAKLF